MKLRGRTECRPARFVDELLWGNSWLRATIFYREVSRCGLNDAHSGIDERKQQLGVNFDGESLARTKAFARLYALKEPVVIIEGSWDGDSLGWLIGLSAITQTPSQSHSKFTESGLCLVRDWENKVEYAEALGQELARVAGACFYLTNATVDDRIRGWDMETD